MLNNWDDIKFSTTKSPEEDVSDLAVTYKAPKEVTRGSSFAVGYNNHCGIPIGSDAVAIGVDYANIEWNHDDAHVPATGPVRDIRRNEFQTTVDLDASWIVNSAKRKFTNFLYVSLVVSMAGLMSLVTAIVLGWI